MKWCSVANLRSVLVTLALVSYILRVQCQGGVVGHSPVPVAKLNLTNDLSSGGYLQGFLEYTDDAGTKYRLCSSRNFFNAHASDLMCKHFGYTGGAIRLPALEVSFPKPLGSLPTITCAPETTDFTECTAAPFLSRADCPPSDTIYVRCYGQGSIRLVDGVDASEGRLQIYLNQTWYNTCSDNFQFQENIEAVCRLAGYKKNETSNFRWVNSTQFDPSNKRLSEPNVYTAYISCTRKNEEQLLNCIGGDAVRVPDQSRCYNGHSDAAFSCGYGAAVAIKKRSGARGDLPDMALAVLTLVLLAILF